MDFSKEIGIETPGILAYFGIVMGKLGLLILTFSIYVLDFMSIL